MKYKKEVIQALTEKHSPLKKLIQKELGISRQLYHEWQKKIDCCDQLNMMHTLPVMLITQKYLNAIRGGKDKYETIQDLFTKN